MNQSENIAELAAALAKAQGEMTPAIKDSKNPFFKSSYADLNSVWASCRIALTKNGLAVTQATDYINDKLMLITTLMHASGQWQKSFMPIIAAKPDAQSMGSAITYARRYSLASMVGVTPDDDDDGNAASKTSNVAHANCVPQQESKLTQAEALELSGLFSNCNDQFKQHLINKNKTHYNASTFNDLPSSIYLPLKHAIISNQKVEGAK